MFSNRKVKVLDIVDLVDLESVWDPLILLKLKFFFVESIVDKYKN